MGDTKRQGLWLTVVWLCCFIVLPIFSLQAQEPVLELTGIKLPAKEDSTWPTVGLGTVSLVVTAGFDQDLAALLQICESHTAALWAAEATSQVVDKAGLLLGHALIYSRNQELAWQSAKAVAATNAVALVLKTTLGRERPDVPGSQGRLYGFNLSDDYHSMPSGHTATAFAMARVLAKDDPKHAYAYYTVATLVGLSRVQLKRHWPSDVVAGALVGFTIGSFF